MGKKVLMVLTSVDKIGSTDKPTGWFLPEMAHPYKVLVDAGFKDIDVISPKGGKSPLDPGSVEMFKEDPVCQWFQKDVKAQSLVNNTKTPAQVKASDYCAVVYPGGHGPMFDLASDVTIAKMAADIYQAGGVVAAVCHGPAALIPIRLANGEQLIKGKKLTAFSNSEEDAVQLTDLMPFPLETRLGEGGAIYSKAAGDWQEHVVVDGRLITGQNPASSAGMAQEVVKQIK